MNSENTGKNTFEIIEISFLTNVEGNKYQLYVPSDSKGAPIESGGATIGIGFDIGQHQN